MSEELLSNTAFDADAVDSIDQSTVEQGGPQFPMIQWGTGDRKLKQLGGFAYGGGWFIEEGAIDEATLLAAGWAKTQRTYSSGKEVNGFSKSAIAISIIALRRCWQVTDGETSRRFSWSKVNGRGGYDEAKQHGKATGKMHVLCIVKGLEDVGPVVLTLSGNSGRNFHDDDVLKRFSETVIAKANAVSAAKAKAAGKQAKKWPWRAFWCPVGAARDDKGNPVFVTVGVGKDTRDIVLPVAVGLPPKPDGVELERFYVGNDLLMTVNDLHAANAAWITAWSDADFAAADDTHAANGNGTTEPQPETAGAAALAEMGL